MTDAIKTYMYARTQQKLSPIDACTDAAAMHGINVYVLADALRALNIDAQRLSVL